MIGPPRVTPGPTARFKPGLEDSLEGHYIFTVLPSVNWAIGGDFHVYRQGAAR